MVVALYLIALAMIGGGAASVAYGYGIILNERGWTMVISGTVALSGGLLLLGIAVTAGRVRRVQQELAGLRDAVSRLGFGVPTRAAPVLAEPIPPTTDPATPKEAPARREEPEEHAVLKAADAIPEPAPVAPPAGGAAPAPEKAAADPSRTVIGTYNSGGNAYVMFSDGSIEADTPTGRYTFQSLDELKDFIASGGEQPARSA
jgi:hypothetical protein